MNLFEHSQIFLILSSPQSCSGRGQLPRWGIRRSVSNLVAASMPFFSTQLTSTMGRSNYSNACTWP